MPALTSSLISPALEQLAGAPGAQLPPARCSDLREFVLSVPDPRDPRGVRHSLASVLLTAVAAVLAGAQSLAAIGEWAGDAPPAVLAALGVRFDPLQGRFQPPGEATIRRVLESVDAAQLDAALTSWLASAATVTGRPRSPRLAVAVDGKALRGTRHSAGDGQAAHLLAAIDQQAGTVLAQTAVDGKTNEITRLAPLLQPLDLAGCVVTADALHTQREHAEYLVTDRQADYILVVKRNQPGLHAQLARLPWRQVPVACQTRGKGHGRAERRTLKVTAVAAGLAFPHAAQALRVTQRTRPLSGRKWRTVTVYAVTSLAFGQATPDELATWIRGHWQIEALHHGRRHLRRGRLPDPHRQRPAGHGHLAEPGHQPVPPGRAPQHRRRLPPPRCPYPHNPRTQFLMRKRTPRHYAEALCAPCWLMTTPTAAPPSEPHPGLVGRRIPCLSSQSL